MITVGYSSKSRNVAHIVNPQTGKAVCGLKVLVAKRDYGTMRELLFREPICRVCRSAQRLLS